MSQRNQHSRQTKTPRVPLQQRIPKSIDQGWATIIAAIIALVGVFVGLIFATSNTSPSRTETSTIPLPSPTVYIQPSLPPSSPAPLPSPTVYVQPSLTPSNLDKTYIVSSNIIWYETGIYVNEGDKVYIQDTEKTKWSIGKEWSGLHLTNGEGQNVTSPNDPMPNVNVGALIGRIGNSEFFEVGKEISFISTNSGWLQLEINDYGDFQDNTGMLTIRVRIN